MVDRVVPADKVLEEAVAYAAQFSGAAALAIRAAKECIDRGSEVDLDTGLEIERQQFAGSLRDRGPYPRHAPRSLRTDRARPHSWDGDPADQRPTTRD